MRRARFHWSTSRMVLGRVACGVVLLVSAGCAHQESRPVVTPNVTWAGQPPHGDLESDPWVQSMRAGFLALAVAGHTVSFTDDALLATWSDGLVQRAASFARESLDYGDAYVNLGPQPFTPVDVDVASDGLSAKVAVCIGWAPKLRERPSEDPPAPEARIFRMVLAPDGHRRITGSQSAVNDYRLQDGEAFDNDDCESVPLEQALFDPSPDLAPLLELTGEDVIAPPSPSPTFTGEVPR